LSLSRTSSAAPRSWSAAAAAVLGLVAADLIFFRVQILNGFTALWGDRADGGIEAAILEHWYNVARGYSDWAQTNYFYPAKRTIGYNDGYFLYGLLHAVFRASGADLFVASQLVDIAVKSIGFLSLFVLLRRHFAAGAGYALLGAALFTLGHATYMQAFHQQLLSVGFAPLLTLLLLDAHAALRAERPVRFALLGGLAALLYGAWLLTAFYMAWFYGLFALCVVLLSPLSGGLRAGRDLPALYWRHRWATLAVAAGLALALVPFLFVYLPKAAETGAHDWANVLPYAPTLNDAVNLGPGNALFGRLFGWLCRYCTTDNYEALMGVPPILMCLFLVGWAWTMLAYRGPHAALLRAVALATVVTWLLTFRFHRHGEWHSLWRLIHDHVPGAKGVRVVARYQVLLTLPVVAIAVLALQGMNRRTPLAILSLLAVLLVLEQLGTGPAVNDRALELARIAVPPPPSECRAFFVTRAEGQDGASDFMRLYPHNVEAMMIAELNHLPTINGFSTFNPPGWDFAEPTRDDYPDRVRRYAERFGLHGLCRLDLRSKQWSMAIP
jgi:hypothetical protein